MSGFPLASAEIFKSNERKSLIIADRSKPTVIHWLKQHETIEVVARDGVTTFFPPKIPAKALVRSGTGLNEANSPVSEQQRKQ